MQQHDMERMFDGIYHKTIPLILFSFLEQQRVFVDLLQSLYDTLHRGDTVSFQEIYNKLNENIENVKSFGSHKDGLINSFRNRYLSLDQRMQNIDSIFLDFKSKIDRINQDHIRLNTQEKSLRKLQPTIKMLKRKMMTIENSKSILKSDENIDIKSDKPSIEKQCNRCGYTWEFKGKGYRIKDHVRIQCPKCKQFFNEKVVE